RSPLPDAIPGTRSAFVGAPRTTSQALQDQKILTFATQDGTCVFGGGELAKVSIRISDRCNSGAALVDF
ncbi:hypothetical protein, partial [Klebsiella pneumoniae]|uniref:hypothetical protein n=1 Tax=Klebsiella pneumoniae TaxID=573 RepID=UPI0039C1B77F